MPTFLTPGNSRYWYAKKAPQEGDGWIPFLPSDPRHFNVSLDAFSRQKATMSAKHEPKDVWCDECDQPVSLRRKGDSTLFVGCDCENSAVRVSQVLPDGWDA